MFLRRMLERIGRLRRHRFTPVQLAVLAFVFVALFVIAVVRFPVDEVEELRPLPGVLAVLLAPTTLVANAFSYRAQVGLLGIRISNRDSIRITLLGSAANLLPVPGAVVVRTADMVDRGATVKQAGGATGVGALIWLGLSLIVAVPPLFATTPGAGVGVAIAAVIAVALSIAGARRLRSSVRQWLVVLSASAGLVAALAIRYVLLVWALGFPPDGSALALVAVGALSSAAGFFPSGIGLRELLAGITATLVSLPASLGYLVAAIDDLAWLATVGIGIVAVEGRGRVLASLQRATSTEVPSR